MRLSKYIKDKLFAILIFIFTYFIILLLLLAFKSDSSLIIAISILLCVSFFLILIIDYFRKYHFYQQLINNIDALDKSYLVLETIPKPTFYEGELWYQAVYNINKSMAENVKIYEEQMSEFKEYIEMWIHEVKIPLSSLILMAHNHQDKFDRKSVEQMRRIDDYVEQVLYYVRSENAEKDYLIKENKLDKIISNVALKNKDDLLDNKVDFITRNVNFSVYTDSKWLEFILNQILNNSIKYKKEGINSYIKITAKEKENKIILMIEDNGIGIPASDIVHVFDKSFTGYNGRIKTKSTGMGLHIVKNLCEKLGHQIKIESIQNEYYEVVK